jgi:dCTP diphosphatase
MKSIDLANLNKNIQAFVDEREWEQFHSLKNLAAALSVESSELLEIFQWLKEEDSNLVMEDPKKAQMVKDEVADIFFYLMRIMCKTGIDLETVVREKIKKNAQKYPVELSKGSIKKYTEL